MKTIFTTITVVVFLCIGIVAMGEQRNSEAGRLNLKDAKKALQANSNGTGQFQLFRMSGNPLSVPQFSEDYTWDEESNSWQQISNTTYTYDGAGRISEEIATEAETDVYLTRNFYSYDEYGNTTEENSYVWNSDRWVPVNGERLIYSYANGFFEEIIEQKIENGMWTNQTKTEYSYNYLDFPVGVRTCHWDGNEWQLYSRCILIKWANWPKRKMANYTLQYWQENNWVNAERYSTQHNGDNYTATTEIWENDQWVYTTKETYLRDEMHEELILENWIGEGWQNSEKYDATFDNYGNTTGIKYSSWEETHWEVETAYTFDLICNELRDVTEMIVRYWDPSLIVQTNVSKYVFSNFLRFTTDVPEITELHNVKVFPNPVGSNFTIQIEDNQITSYQVNMVNLAGQTIFSNTFSDSSVSVNAEDFTPGMYLLNIKSDEGKIYTGKLVKN